MSPEEISSLFAAALEQFEPVIGQPTDPDLTRLREALIQVLLVIPFDEETGQHNLVGLLLDKADYQALYGAPFSRPTRPGIYPSNIDDDAKAPVRARLEAEHAAKLSDYKTYDAAERDTQRFILAVIEDTWIRELKDPTTFYTQVLAVDLLDHLQTICGGLHALDILNLQNEMQKYHLEAEGVPEYINLLEDAQKRSKRAGNPVTDATLVVIATNAMLTTEQFPRTNEDWEELDVADRTWLKWKDLYRAAEKKSKIKKKAAGGKDQFGSANAATTENLPPSDSEEPMGLASLEGYFDNLAAAAVNEKAVLESLVASNATLTTSNAELSATVTKLTSDVRHLQQENNALRKKTNAPTAPAVPPPPPPQPRRGWETRQTLFPTARLCANCKRVVRHMPDNCHELEKNASLRPPGWTSVL